MHVQYVRGLGATHVVDYNAGDPVAAIRAVSGGRLAVAYDTVGRCAAAAAAVP